MSKQDIINKLQQDLVSLQQKVRLLEPKDAYISNEILDRFYNLVVRIDDLNNNAVLTNMLENEFSFYSDKEVEKFLEFKGFTKSDMQDVNEPLNLENLNTDEANQTWRNVAFRKIQKKLDELKLTLNEHYVIFNKNKYEIEEITVKIFEKLIKNFLEKLNLID